MQGDPMKNWPVAWAAGLTLAWLARRFSSPALPDPGPLPASVPIPRAEPPEDMELIAVPGGDGQSCVGICRERKARERDGPQQGLHDNLHERILQ